MLLQLIPGGSLTTPASIFWLIVEIAIIGIGIAAIVWAIRTFILPYVPAPFQWIINVLIGIVVVAILIWLFFGGVR